MTDIAPELRAAIDVAKQRVKVDSYHTLAVYRTFKGHAQGLWAGIALGTITGAFVGVCITGALALMSVSNPFIGIPLILGCAGLGGVTGGTVGSDAVRTAGGIAGVMAEKERREKADKLEEEILRSPEKQREVVEAYRADPVVETEKTIGETLASHRDDRKAWGKIFDLKNMLLTVTLCVAASVIMFGGAYLLGGGALTGLLDVSLFGSFAVPSFASALGVGAAVGTAMGIAFGISFPMIFTSFSKGTADILGAQLVNGKSAHEPIRTVEELEEQAIRLRRDTEAREANGQPVYAVHNVAQHDRVLASEQQVSA